jgi:hypothetical protein
MGRDLDIYGKIIGEKVVLWNPAGSMEPLSTASAWCGNLEETIRTRSKPANTVISSAGRLLS